MAFEKLRRLSFNSDQTNRAEPARKPNKGYWGETDDMPLVFTSCVNYVEERGLDEEGIMRISGREADKKVIKNLLQEGKNISTFHHLDIHSVASVLKSYFNDAPSAFFPEEDYAALIAIGQNDTPEGLQLIRKMISALPLVQQKILHRLVIFLDNISKHSAQNKMEIYSLSVIFGALLIRSPSSLSPSQALADNSVCVILIQKMIENHPVVFEGLGLNLSPKDAGVLRKNSSVGTIQASPDKSATPTTGTTATPNKRASTGLGEGARVRSIFESAVNEMKENYEKARVKRQSSLKEARELAILEYRSTRDKADKQNEAYSKVQALVQEANEKLEQSKKLRDEAAAHAAEVMKEYGLSDPSGAWRDSINMNHLKKDQLAHLEELQTFLDLKEAEYALLQFDQEEADKVRAVAEVPYTTAQTAFTNAAKELARLGISNDDVANWSN